jgi:DNA mismatch endonuclease (patch repair protein)
MEGKYIPKTNAIFWISKLKKNIQRDTDVNAFLQIEGWTVVRFWEEDIRKDSERCALKVKLLVKMI